MFPSVLDWINVYRRRRCDADQDNEVRIGTDGAGRDVVGSGGVRVGDNRTEAEGLINVCCPVERWFALSRSCPSLFSCAQTGFRGVIAMSDRQGAGLVLVGGNGGSPDPVEPPFLLDLVSETGICAPFAWDLVLSVVIVHTILVQLGGGVRSSIVMAVHRSCMVFPLQLPFPSSLLVPLLSPLLTPHYSAVRPSSSYQLNPWW